MKLYPGPHGPYRQCPSFLVTYASSPSLLWGCVSSSQLGTGMGPIPSLTFPMD